MNSLYTTDSIESLSPLEFTRLRPGVYCGDTEFSTQLLVEILSNAVDEFRLGHGDIIEVTINNINHIYSVRDYGQGFIPNSYRDDGKTILEAAFSVLNTSGKYREDGTYEGTSLGSFGIGSKITTFLSHWLKVATYRNGEMEFIKFKEGEFQERENHATDQANGTFVQWQPSEEFFTHSEVEVSKVKNLLQTLSCLCSGLTIELNLDNNEKVIYRSKNGLNDLVDEAVKDKEIIKSRFNFSFIQGKYKGEMVLTYTSRYLFSLVPYVNAGLTESGPHITQIKTTLTKEFNKFFKEKGWLKEREDNLAGEDLQEGEYIVFNVTAPNVAYDAQVKSRVTQIDVKPFIQEMVSQLRIWLNANEKEIKIIADKAITARKARDAAKKTKDTIRENQKKKRDKVLKFDSKLADCFSKDRSKCEIYVVEGDSAAGNLKAARDNKFQAVMPVRGKILNVAKASLNKIQKNAEIMTMIEAFGLSIDSKSIKIEYNEKDLRYDKIIIMSDGDVDGSHIKNLFYTFIWNFCPQLILDGHIYAGVPPLYKVITSTGYKYLKNDNALEEYRQQNQGKKYEIKRMKGLGELSIDETEETLINPKNRTIKKITVHDIEEVDILFDQLMGTAVIPRKNFIIQHSKEAKYAI